MTTGLASYLYISPFLPFLGLVCVSNTISGRSLGYAKLEARAVAMEPNGLGFLQDFLVSRMGLGFPSLLLFPGSISVPRSGNVSQQL
jgi:hypothetical protein